jgi:hypothetical protein
MGGDVVSHERKKKEIASGCAVLIYWKSWYELQNVLIWRLCFIAKSFISYYTASDKSSYKKAK